VDSIGTNTLATNDTGSKHMNSVSIRAGLLSLFGLMTLLIGGLGYLSITKVSYINDNVTAFATHWFPARDMIGRINVGLDQLKNLEAQHMVSASAEEMTALEQKILETKDKINKALRSIQKLDHDDVMDRAIQALQAKIASYDSIQKRFIELSRKSSDNTQETGKLYKGEMEAAFAEVTAIIDATRDRITESANKEAEKATSEYERGRFLSFVAIGFGLVLTVGAMAFAFYGVSRPIEQITLAMSALAKGDASASIPFADSRNEIGAMAGAVQIFKDNMVRTRELEREAEAAQAKTEADRKRAMAELADRFERTVGGIVTTVSDAAAELQAAAQALSSSSAQTTHQSTVVAAASEEAASNVRTVAAAAEQLSGSVREISRQVSMSSTIARKAVEEAEETNEQVSGLSVGAQKIGAIVDLINDIASKTNLLALNATIEAARAGEAGRGFAVVAQEVKALAEQTGKATAEITSHIASVQTSTDQAANAILGIGRTIDEINQIATGIAAAVEEQGAATEEIARNVDQAALGTTEVTRNITGVNQAAEASSASANQVLSAATELSSQSDKLRTEMERFLSTVRAA
jgi:methyl-accepting chemotaxis protein